VGTNFNVWGMMVGGSEFGVPIRTHYGAGGVRLELTKHHTPQNDRVVVIASLIYSAQLANIALISHDIRGT
jgi:hypothetical protein